VTPDAWRYRWLVERSGLDLRTLLGVGDFTSLDAFIDRRALPCGACGETAPDHCAYPDADGNLPAGWLDLPDCPHA
jgi:hypothetical protein